VDGTRWLAEAHPSPEEGETTRTGEVDWLFVFSYAAFNLISIPKLRGAERKKKQRTQPSVGSRISGTDRKPNNKTHCERALLRTIRTLREGYVQQAP
jgi:hypothetical protein